MLPSQSQDPEVSYQKTSISNNAFLNATQYKTLSNFTSNAFLSTGYCLPQSYFSQK